MNNINLVTDIVFPKEVISKMKEVYPKHVDNRYFFVFENLVKREIYYNQNGHKVVDGKVLATIQDVQNVLPYFSNNY